MAVRILPGFVSGYTKSTLYKAMTLMFLFCFCFKGPFTDINAEEVEEEIGGMYRTVLKLTKTFSDAPGPRRVADSVKSKVDKFKVHIPLLQIICNPGLRERHWEQVPEFFLKFVAITFQDKFG